MSIHPDGTGEGWTNVELVDVEQPHGKDYLYSQHIAKGVRKRIDQEHSSFADATVGGIHTPGGCAVLGMEITDDCTAPVVGDGTYRGHGILWTLSKDTSNYGVLWCATKAAGSSTTGDWTVLKMHPDLQWSGQDVTWAGAHEFDASVDISGNVAFDGDISVDGTAAFTDASFDGTVDFGGAVVFGTDVSFDGTVDFGDGVAFVAEVSIDGILLVDGTASEFGGAVGTALFYDPTVMAGADDSVGTITLPNGLIIKWGKLNRTGTDTTLTFAAAFPNNCFQVICCGGAAAGTSAALGSHTITKTNCVVRAAATCTIIRWIAVGR